MEKTQSKPLAARHGRGTAWEQHGMCELVLKVSAAIDKHKLTVKQIMPNVDGSYVRRTTNAL
jgi:hypothetical protein